jgi:Rrf2 family protein
LIFQAVPVSGAAFFLPAQVCIIRHMINKKAKYGLKALLHIARVGKSEPISIHHIADEEKIPRKFLEAILLELRNAGILTSTKGRGGGYRFQKPSDIVSLAEVVRILDGPLALSPCVSLHFYHRCDECVNEATCELRPVFLKLRDQTLAVMERTTIADLVRDGGSPFLP